MTKFIHTLIKLGALVIFTLPLLLSSPVYSQGAGSPQLTKLAKKFNVSPATLTKFADMNANDIKSGLDIAKQLSAKGELSMDAATSKVLGAAADGDDWNKIASDFGVDEVAGTSGDNNLVESETPSKPGRKKGPRK